MEYDHNDWPSSSDIESLSPVAVRRVSSSDSSSFLSEDPYQVLTPIVTPELNSALKTSPKPNRGPHHAPQTVFHPYPPKRAPDPTQGPNTPTALQLPPTQVSLSGHNVPSTLSNAALEAQIQQLKTENANLALAYYRTTQELARYKQSMQATLAEASNAIANSDRHVSGALQALSYQNRILQAMLFTQPKRPPAKESAKRTRTDTDIPTPVPKGF